MGWGGCSRLKPAFLRVLRFSFCIMSLNIGYIEIEEKKLLNLNNADKLPKTSNLCFSKVKLLCYKSTKKFHKLNPII